jgi:hypothetical protein|tara:strand:+ start:440 stop:763 length:324 start_codon:yes stop_codon:yes gene_type:complete
MKKNNFITILILCFLITSCADTFSSVKRGITGAKQNTTDEFLVKKKDPLVLPPDFENLPTPDEQDVSEVEVSSFEEKLKDKSIEDEDSDASSNTSSEMSILKQIRKK